MSRFKTVLIVAALALLLVGVTPASAQTPSPEEAVQALLDTRVRAIQQRDEAAFARTIDPEADSVFRQRELLAFRGAVTAPLTDLTLTADTEASGDLAAGVDLATQHRADVAFAPATVRRYRLGDYDAVPAVDTRWYTYVERNGAWFVATDDDFAGVGLRNTVAIFDLGPVVATTSTNFLALSSEDKQARARDILELAEVALGRTNAAWTIPWSDRLPVIIPDNPDQTTVLLQNTVDVSRFVAFVSYTPLRNDRDYSVTAPRLFTQDGNLLSQSAAAQTNTLTHELTHAASALESGPFTPTWLQEGTAEWVRLGRPEAYGHTDIRALPDNGDFAGAQLGTAYQNAASAVAALAAIGGPDAPQQLYVELGRRRVTPGTPAYNVDAAFRSVMNMGVDTFTQRWLALT